MSQASVQIFEVGPRDGLQNVPQVLKTAQKIAMVRALRDAGLKDIEAGAFVRPDRVPQMADSDKVFNRLNDLKGARLWALLPNQRGFDRARMLGVRNVAFFLAATEKFNQANNGVPIRQSLKMYQGLADQAAAKNLRSRAYLSTAFGCPYEGKVSASKVFRVYEKILKLDVQKIAVSDTIGVATPGDVEKIIGGLVERFGADRIAVHFHDTHGTAVANSLMAYQLGVRMFDSSVGGLGGCPFAPGATGNLATEDLVYLFDGMKVKTGIDLDKLVSLSQKVARQMGQPIASRVVNASLARRRPRSRSK